MPGPRPRALTIAGSDPSGGAGVQADLKSFAAFGCHGMAVVAVLTAQDTTAVRGVHVPPPGFTMASLDAVLGDCPPAATKTGMLFDAAVIEGVAERLAGGRGGPVVVDPVMLSTSRDALLRPDAVERLVRDLLPIAACVTPNIPEAEALTGRRIANERDAWDAAAALLDRGPAAVLVKGGHLGGAESIDLLLERGGARTRWARPRLAGVNPHGAGCTLSAAIAAGLAHGRPPHAAVAAAGDWVRSALAAAQPQGRGAVPLDHCVPPRSEG
jgi:hydroxymethylpyrimidine/phosphomethylpyrimidine kinase